MDKGNLEVVVILADLCPEDLNVISKSYWDDETPLSLAIQDDNIDIVKELLAAGADPDKQFEHWDRESPLSLAVGEGYTEIVKELLSCGC